MAKSDVASEPVDLIDDGIIDTGVLYEDPEEKEEDDDEGEDSGA